MSILLSADYAYALEDYNTMLGCPQCRADRQLAVLGEWQSESARAWRLVCLEVRRFPHECGAAGLPA